MSLGSKKHISSKIVITIIVMCVTCTTIAFLVSVLCYVRRRKRHHPIQSPMISSSDKETSYSSTSNFISQRTSFVPDIKGAISSPISHITRKMDFELIISVAYYIAIIFCSYLPFFCFFFFRMLSKSLYLVWESKRNISWKYYSVFICWSGKCHW
jgi:hypothetical protein